MLFFRNLKQLLYISFISLLFSSVYSAPNEFKNSKNNKSSIASNHQDENCSLVHAFGKLVLGVDAGGRIGGIEGFEFQDCFTGALLPYKRNEFPKGSSVTLSHAITTYFAGVKKRDTLVTQSHYYGYIVDESEYRTLDYLIKTKIKDSDFFDKDAISELDITVTGTDIDPDASNYIYSGFNARAHRPLGIESSRTSYSWSYDYSQDFVLFEQVIKNISDEPIKDFYLGFTTYNGSGYSEILDVEGKGDIVGFLKDYSYQSDCEYDADLNMMWFADGDGDPYNGQFSRDIIIIDNKQFRSAPDVSGILPLSEFKEISPYVKTSFNWWATLDMNDFFMPIAKATERQQYQSNYSHPYGDNTVYAIMSNNEIDYDQIYTSSISQYDPIWNYPNQLYARDISDGFPGPYITGNHTHNIISIGPFDIPPGATLKIPFAYVAGEDLHTIPANGNNLPDYPDIYYNNLDFSDIATNAQWAKWIYDNPGVDTDGDGDSGSFTICVLDSQFTDNQWNITAADTFWYKGDGIPDWKAAGPPPAPYMWLTPILNGVKVRINGSESETEKDLFTRIADFEGYNIYIGRDERETSLSLIASYDLKNYDKYVYDFAIDLYVVGDLPLTLEEIRCAYADSCNDTSFDPLTYGRLTPLAYKDSLFYFREHSYNTEDAVIKKTYPNVRDPRLVHIDSLVDSDYTDDGFLKFFEYEYTIENLLPTVGYWINVTAFDFGSPKSGLPALETEKTLNLQLAYPKINEDDSSGIRKQVYVYPNPYRIDAEYRKLGFEGRNQDDRPDYRLRELHFANLPPQCEIKIYSLDGDLIRHLSHDLQPDDPTAHHHSWNLITRNTQMVVSGLYYWTVEFPDGDVQIGKFVVVM